MSCNTALFVTKNKKCNKGKYLNNSMILIKRISHLLVTVGVVGTIDLLKYDKGPHLRAFTKKTT